MATQLSPFAKVEAAPADPILGLTEQFNADPNPNKVNLGVGVYQDASGKLPLLECVRKAEERLIADPKPRPYLPIDGLPAYDAAVKDLVFGADSDAVRQQRVISVQALGGTGALRVGADFLRPHDPDAPVYISRPSWENHQQLFTRAGFDVREYRYYDPDRRGIDFEGMLADLAAAPAGSIVVLHACCHNPTGYDLTQGQWAQVRATVERGNLIPFLDMAYQGFSQGLEADAAVVRDFAASGSPMLCATSFSKSFALYGERVGALHVVCSDAAEAARVLSQLKTTVRANYSNPPTHGAAIVASVLQAPQLRATWEDELAGMRDRIKLMRQHLLAGLNAAGVSQDMSFITKQIGMFSYSGLTRDQMLRLRQDYSVYGTDAGRMCMAGLNDRNIDYVSASIAAVLG
jgi:aromatic-amino-acid transaminase